MPTETDRIELKGRKYTQQLIEYANQSIQPHELGIFKTLFEELSNRYSLVEANDLMLLDIVCYDFLRIKRLQSALAKEGDVIKMKLKDGREYRKINEASGLINSIEVQLRGNMKELMLTKREIMKKGLGVDAKDFSSYLGDIKDAEYKVEDGKG